MAPGYQGRIGRDELKHRLDALSGDDFNPGVESEDPAEDRRLRAALRKRLEGHPELDVSNVELNVEGGFVSITGTVDNIDQKATVEAFVAKTDGVLDVVNFLQLRRGEHLSGSDGALPG
jgi:hypothetical protein